jgi:hypothetical protein
MTTNKKDSTSVTVEDMWRSSLVQVAWLLRLSKQCGTKQSQGP